MVNISKIVTPFDSQVTFTNKDALSHAKEMNDTQDAKQEEVALQQAFHGLVERIESRQSKSSKYRKLNKFKFNLGIIICCRGNCFVF